MNKKLFAVPFCAVFVLSAAFLSACGGKPDSGTGGDTEKYGLKPTENYVLPEYSERTDSVMVHDPSIYQDQDGKYYAFGTHYAVASSDDLIHWEQEVPDGSINMGSWKNKLYSGEDAVKINGIEWPKALEETVKLVNPVSTGSDAITTTWAPDVEYYNGKYYMYYSVTGGFGRNTSAIARVESENVLGPYSNNKIILQSVDEEKDNFVSGYDTAGGKPNCIDSELFYDKSGKLWMVYGSHFGGVYIKELNNSGKDWGLPKEAGAGKLLWMGGNKVVEGPYVFYNAATNYYYLMTSYGALMTDYNMHVARSENPDGPYVDISGKNMAELTKAEAGNVYGNKIAGNYKFASQGSTQGYAALGHNSVIKDKDGKYFVIYHTRRTDGVTVTAGHNLCASQLFFNEEGWPVMSPVCYEGETFGIVPEADVAKTYEVIIHATETTTNMVTSESYELVAGGTVKKGTADAGTWSLKDGFYITITIDSVEYNGVIVPGWDMYKVPVNQRAGQLCVTAVSDAGVSLWAIAK